MATNRPYRRLTLSLLLAAGATAGAAPADPAVRMLAFPDLELRVELPGALYRDGQEGTGPTLFLAMSRTDDFWSRALVDAPSYNKGRHDGLVLRGAQDGDAIELEVTVAIGGDPYVPGGRGRYAIRAGKASPDRYEGTYAGTFRGREVKGAARVFVHPKPAPDAGRPPASLDEHPRLLFRAADLPALQAKAQTPFGQAALASMDGVIGRALRHRLSGDRALAGALVPAVEAMLADNSVGDKLVRGRVLGWRFERLALAYDLCADAWPESLRRRVEDLVVGSEGARAFFRPWTFQKEIQWTPTAIYPGPIRYGPALATLATLGRKGAEPPPPPASPFLHEDPLPLVPAPTDYVPAAGVPVATLATNEAWQSWLCAGGFPALPGQGGLRGFEAIASLRAEPGGTARVGAREKPFRTADKFYGGQLCVTDLAGREFETAVLFFAAVRAERAQAVRMRIGGSGRAWLAGTELRDGDAARVEAGVYPLVVAAWTGKQSQWGNDLVGPRLTPLAAAEADAWVADMRAEHAERVRAWEHDRETWRRSGGLDLAQVRQFEWSRHWMRLFFREAVGAGGFAGVNLYSLEGPDRYAAAYRTMFGTDVTPCPDVSRLLGRAMSVLRYADAGPGVGAEIDGAPAFAAQAMYIEGSLPFHNALFGSLYGLSPAEWKPALLWGWRRQAGAADPAAAAPVLAMPARPYQGFDYDAHRAWVFVNYPAGDPDRPPDGVLPLAWSAPDHGWYGFRNAWRDRDDAVTQVFLRRGETGGEAAGAFRIAAFGVEWTPGGFTRRLFENVVQLPDDELQRNGRAGLLRYEAGADGSGQVAMDLGDLYAKPGPRFYEPIFGSRREDAPVAPGLRGGRTVAIDYSGACGAPALVVVADRIAGGGQRVWSWPLEFTHETMGARDAAKKALAGLFVEKEYAAYTQDELRAYWRKVHPGSDRPLPVQGDMAIEANRFTLRKEGAVLRCTVAGLTEPLALRSLEEFAMGAKHTQARDAATSIAAAAGDTMLAVITLGRGEPPAVEVAGAGDALRVTVGGRAIRLDGDRIVLGPAR